MCGTDCKYRSRSQLIKQIENEYLYPVRDDKIRSYQFFTTKYDPKDYLNQQYTLIRDKKHLLSLSDGTESVVKRQNVAQIHQLSKLSVSERKELLLAKYDIDMEKLNFSKQILENHNKVLEIVESLENILMKAMNQRMEMYWD